MIDIKSILSGNTNSSLEKVSEKNTQEESNDSVFAKIVYEDTTEVLNQPDQLAKDINNDGFNDYIEEYDNSGNVERRVLDNDYDRIFDEEQLVYPDGSYLSLPYDAQSLDEGKMVYDKIKVDGVIDDSQQQSYGDCWLLSSLKGLSQTEIGSKLLKDSIKVNRDGSYTVSFEPSGDALKYSKLPNFINKLFGLVPDNVSFKKGKMRVNISQREMRSAKENLENVKGDDDVLLLELAYDNYYKVCSPQRKGNEKHYIDGGNLIDVFVPLYGESVKDKVEVATKTREMYDLIGKYDKTQENSVCFLGFSKNPQNTTIYDKKGNKVDLGKNHAWSLKSYNKENNTLTMINPYDSDDEIEVDYYSVLSRMDSVQYLNLKNC